MTTTRTATNILIYWDNQDPDNEGWAYRTSDVDGTIESGGLYESGTLDEAIDEAMCELDIDLTHDDFACEPRVDGGYAIWIVSE